MSIARLYRKVLRTQRAVFGDDQQTITFALQWTRNVFQEHSDYNKLAEDMTWLCTFLTNNLAQLESSDGRVFKLKWRDTLEVDDGNAMYKCC